MQNQLSLAPRSRPHHWRVALSWLGVLIGTIATTEPARAGDEAEQSPVPFEAIYVPEKTSGTVVVHPAALARQPGIDFDLAQITQLFAKAAKGQPLPAPPRLEFSQIETVVMGVGIKISAQPNKTPGEPDQISLNGSASGFAVRTVAPFEWLAWLRALPLSLQEVKDGDRTYYTIVVPREVYPDLFPKDLPFAVCLPDDRTMVVESESFIKKLIHRAEPMAPSYLQGEGWARISQGMVAVAVNNTDDALLRAYNPKHQVMDEIMLLVERVRGTERLMVGISADDAGALTVQAEGVARDEALARSIAASLGLYALVGRAEAAFSQPNTREDVEFNRLLGKACKQAQIAATGRSVRLTLPNFLGFADLIALFNDGPATADPAVQPAKLESLPAGPAKIDPASVPGRLNPPPP